MSSLLDSNGCLDQSATKSLENYADLMDCECPHQLLVILEQIRSFRTYTTSCIIKYPSDASTHKWLASSATNLDKMLSATIIQLARKEGFVNEENELVARDQVAKPTAKAE